ncbi:uncharacterized protein [Neodiprion pinetum]|uniref:uncharacterized protein n=1 Tax=Neodiprion pinetum TaxID=441929 RepID=UPI001EE04F55|nr:uncharacterized protein LOC124223118 [Neodiprion pinetum]
MNYFLLTFACLFIASEVVLARPGDFHVAVREKCFAETGMEHESEDAAYFANPKVKSYLRCFFEGKHLFRENGDFDTAGFLVLIDNDDTVRAGAKPLAEKCVKKHSKIEDRREMSYEVMKCFFEGYPAIFPQMGIFEPPHGW